MNQRLNSSAISINTIQASQLALPCKAGIRIQDTVVDYIRKLNFCRSLDKLDIYDWHQKFNF
jgi:hypothetical protein